MLVLVTGANGFLGSALTARLRAQGVRVRALVRPGRAALTDADEICEGDLTDSAALARAVAGVERVFHAGARVSTNGAWEEFEAANVRGTEDLIRLAGEAGVQRFVHVSSVSVYAVTHDGAVVTEDGPFDDTSEDRGFYARSKLAADRIAQEAIGRGAPVVIVRPCLLYGPGQVPPLARRAISVGPLRLILAGRDYRLPLAYVDNVADALWLASDVPAAVGRAYTIVDAHLRQDEYARLYRQVSGQSWTPVFLPLAPIRLAVSAVEGLARAVGKRSPITRHQVERTLRSAVFSVERAERELGWRPRIAVEEALRRSFAAPRLITASGNAAPANSIA